MPSEPDSPWPRTAPPAVSGRLRVAPEDFVVDELMSFSPTGEGEHLWVSVRKRGFNTDQVARELARAADVPRRNVGYAGMKDRHAVTTQWFSIHLPGKELLLPPAAMPAGIDLLEQVRHARKLHTGALLGNRFAITLRDCAGDRAVLAARLEHVRRHGVPNYFGEQRFGHNGANVDRARALFAGSYRTRDRHLRGIYLSAARAWLFNALLATRVSDGSWDRGVPGEAFILNGTHSFFVADAIDATLHERLARYDVHPSGPLWGKGESPARGEARALEDAVMLTHTDLARGLEQEGLRQERRALRVVPVDLIMEWVDDTSLGIAFSLPSGCYATTVLRELVEYVTVSAVVGEE